MKKVLLIVLLFMFTILVSGYGTANYMESGGTRWVIGGSADVATGGEIDIESGGVLKLTGTAIISSAAELNLINGLTPGTVTLSKALVVNANKDLGDFRNLDAINIDAGSSGVVGTVDIFPTTAANGKLIISATNNGGARDVTLTNAAHGQATTVTIPDTGLATSYVAQSTAALTAVEVDVLDAVTPGTAASEKALVLGSSGEIATITTATITTGNIVTVNATNIDAGASGVVGTVDIFPTTAANGKFELTCTNQGSDITSILDLGAQSQANTITIPDVNLAASYIALSTASLTAAEVDVLDAATAGTQVAFKAVIADTNTNIGVTKITDLYLGTTGAETQVTASGAELNYNDITAAGTAEASKALITDGSIDISGLNAVGIATLTVTNDIITGAEVGTAGAGVTAVEYGTSGRHKTVLTVAAYTQGVVSANLGFGKSIYTFPEGFIKVDYATIDLTIFATASTVQPDVGLGSEVSEGVITVLSGSATFEDYMDGFTATAITTTPGSVTNNYVVAEAGVFDGHTTASPVFLNMAGAWVTTENLTIAATVTIYWTHYGDY